MKNQFKPDKEARYFPLNLSVKVAQRIKVFVIKFVVNILLMA